MFSLDRFIKRHIRTPSGRRRFGIIGTFVGLGIFFWPVFFIIGKNFWFKYQGIDKEEKRKEYLLDLALKGGNPQLRHFRKDRMLLKEHQDMIEVLEEYLSENDDDPELITLLQHLKRKQKR